MTTFGIQYHRENPSHRFVVVVGEDNGQDWWFSYETLAEAEEGMPRIASVWDTVGHA